jgi:hypothetical protein
MRTVPLEAVTRTVGRGWMRLGLRGGGWLRRCTARDASVAEYQPAMCRSRKCPTEISRVLLDSCDAVTRHLGQMAQDLHLNPRVRRPENIAGLEPVVLFTWVQYRPHSQ